MPGDTRGYEKPGSDEQPTGKGLKGPKLPKNIQPLPDDTPESVWKLWPRYVEARVFFPQIRERNLTAKVASGQIPCFYCPDGSARLNRDHLVALWGEPDATPPRPNPLSAEGRALRGDDGRRSVKELTSADLELDDPVVGMFRECREMLRDAREDIRQLLKNALEPVTAGVKFLKETCDAQTERIKELEGKWESSLRQRAEDEEYRFLRDLELARETAKEKRRSDVVEILRSQVPRVVEKWSGGSLRDFVKTIDPALIDTMIESNVLDADHIAQIQSVRAQLVEIAKREKQAAEKKAAKEKEQPAASAAANGAGTHQQQKESAS